MRKVVVENFGAPSVLQIREVETPQPSAGQADSGEPTCASKACPSRAASATNNQNPSTCSGICALSGAQAHYGKDNENGVRMAIEDL